MMAPQTYTQVTVLSEGVDLQWLPPRLLNDCLGQCLSDNQEIQLRDNLRGIQCLDTLLHELNHYISDRTGAELSEHQVHLLGMAWSSIFYENPELLGWIAERCVEEDGRRIK